MKKKFGTSHWEISIFCTVQKYDNITTPYYPIFIQSSVCGRLQEAKSKRKFQIFSSTSGHGRLREVVAYKRFEIFWKTGLWEEVVTTRGSTVYLYIHDRWLLYEWSCQDLGFKFFFFLRNVSGIHSIDYFHVMSSLLLGYNVVNEIYMLFFKNRTKPPVALHYIFSLQTFAFSIQGSYSVLASMSRLRESV